MSRTHSRAPVGLKVEYRTTGAFLVSYTTNLSHGGLFVETPSPLPEGTRVTLRLHVPGAEDEVETEAVVAWSRREPSADGEPAGMGMRFEAVDERLGGLVDRLVTSFAGLAIAIVAATPAARAQVSRLLRGVLSCRIVEADSADVAEKGIDGPVDLAIVDLDAPDGGGPRAIQTLRASATPVVAIGGPAAAHEAARTAGADEVVEASPSLAELRRAVLAALGRPTLLSF